MRSSTLPILVSATAALVLAACGSSSPNAPTSASDPLSGSITVFAASSLTNPFNNAEKALKVTIQASRRSTPTAARRHW